MKKSLLALAVLGAFAASAQAQTAVTIYGSFDGGIRHTTDVNAAGDNRTTVGSNGTYNSNRIGFRGVEDLGGGLKARFTLENGFNTGTGALNNTTNRLFERTAAVGFGGDFGFIDIGRQYTNAFLTVIQYDPFSFKYPAITGLSTPITDATAGTRYDNDVKYTGTFGPVTARAEYAFGEAAGSASRGSSASVSASYATGPLAIGGAFTRRNDRGATAAGAAGPDNDHFTVGGAYKLGPVRLTAGYSRDEQDAATGSTVENKNRNAWVGVGYAVSPAVELIGAYYDTKRTGVAAFVGDREFFILSATYALSKRTNFYAAADFAKLEGSLRVAAPQDRQRGISVGVNHLF